MSYGIVAVMIGVSTFIGFLGLLGFIWGLKNGQFDDEKKIMQGVLFDGVSDLNEAASRDVKNGESCANPKN